MKKGLHYLTKSLNQDHTHFTEIGGDLKARIETKLDSYESSESGNPCRNQRGQISLNFLLENNKFLQFLQFPTNDHLQCIKSIIYKAVKY